MADDAQPAPPASPTAWPARLTGWLGALCTAGLVTLALPTTELWPLALIAFVPLLLVLPGRTRWQRFRLGWLAGFAFQLVLFRWIPFTMSEMTSFPELLTWGMCILYALWHGLQIGLFAMLAIPLQSACEERLPRLTPIALAVFYASLEWAFPALFPWSWGHALWEVGPVAGPVLAFQGVPLLTATLMLANTLLAALVGQLLARRPWAPTLPRPPLTPLAHLAPATLTLLLLPLAALSLRAALEGPPERTLRVAVLQPNYVLAEKKKADFQMRKTLLDRLERMLRTLPPDTYDLVVGSEGAFPMWWRLDADTLPTTGQPFQVEATRRVQRAIAEGPRAHTILGGLRHTEAGETRNAAVHLGPDGHILGHYDKKTLVPFSEYMPLAEYFPALKDIKGIGHMEPGATPCAFEAGLPVTCGICYESMFAGDTRADAGPARLIANLTIDTWFGRSTAPRMHLMSHASRAAELGVPLVRAALTGITAVIDHHGQVLDALPMEVEGVLDVRVPLPTGTTVYREVGQLFAPLGALATLALLVLAARDHRRARRALSTPPGEAA